jgi:hypothetical protein
VQVFLTRSICRYLSPVSGFSPLSSGATTIQFSNSIDKTTDIMIAGVFSTNEDILGDVVLSLSDDSWALIAEEVLLLMPP